MFKTYGETESLNHRLFKIYDDSESQNEGACLRYVMNRQKKGGVFKIYDAPESANEGAC